MYKRTENEKWEVKNSKKKKITSKIGLSLQNQVRSCVIVL